MVTQVPAGPNEGSELRLWLAVTRRLPRLRGAGRISQLIEYIYNRKKRPNITADVLGFKMLLDSSDNLESQFLFCPHLYDREEVAYLREHLKPGHIFVDAGANVGFYSLIASNLVGPDGLVLAIEADPSNASRLETNLRLNDVRNVRLVNAGLSDKSETLRLGLNTTGNRSGHSFLSDGPETVDVACKSLTEVLLSEGVRSIDGAKFDIEGFEFKVLQKFFQDGLPGLWPKFFIVESNPSFAEKTGGDTLGLLSKHDYVVRQISELNYFAVRR